MSSWVDLNCKSSDIVPRSRDTTALLKAIGSSVGMQQWCRFEEEPDACGIYVSIVNKQAALDCIYNPHHKAVYGASNPIKERVFYGDWKSLFNDIGLRSTLKWDRHSHILIIVHLQTTNHIVIRKVPKDATMMFGSNANRDRFLSELGAIGPLPDEITEVS